MAESIVVQGENITVDILLVRRFGFAGQRLLEETLELNHGLAELGPILPLGTVVEIPDEPDANDPPVIPSISLFD